MPQERKSETTGLLILGAVALFFILRARGGGLAAGNGGAIGLDLSMTGPGPEPATVTAQPFQPALRPGGGVIPFDRQAALGTQIVEGAILAFERPGTGIGTQLVRPQQPKPQFIPVAEFERRFPRGIVTQKTGAEQFGEAVQSFFGGLFRR